MVFYLSFFPIKKFKVQLSSKLERLKAVNSMKLLILMNALLRVDIRCQPLFASEEYYKRRWKYSCFKFRSVQKSAENSKRKR